MVDDLSAEEFSTWISAREALAIVSEGMDGNKNVAGLAIIDRLKGGVINAVASQSSLVSEKMKDPIIVLDNFIPARDWSTWGTVEHWNMWATNSIRFYKGNIDGVGDSVFISYFNIKFNPKDIADMIPSSTFIAENEEYISKTDTVKSTNPPISEAHLRLWHELYIKIYKDSAAATLTHAIASAKGMFPDKSVGRDKVRALRAGGKPGPKKTSTET